MGINIETFDFCWKRIWDKVCCLIDKKIFGEKQFQRDAFHREQFYGLHGLKNIWFLVSWIFVSLLFLETTFKRLGLFCSFAIRCFFQVLSMLAPIFILLLPFMAEAAPRMQVIFGLIWKICDTNLWVDLQLKLWEKSP